MAVAYYRPFMGSMRPDGTKAAPIDDETALAVDPETHLNLKRFRHEACAHKDLSPRTMNIPVVKIRAGGAMEIHSLLPVGIEPDECARIRALCFRLVEILEAEAAGLLKKVGAPAPGEYTLNHEDGPWLVPLNPQLLGRVNLDRA
jgi:hypothetical protein